MGAVRGVKVRCAVVDVAALSQSSDRRCSFPMVQSYEAVKGGNRRILFIVNLRLAVGDFFSWDAKTIFSKKYSLCVANLQ